MKTCLTAVFVISIVVLLVMRMPIGFLLVLSPNLFPAVMVLGAAGHLRFALDAASLMTASGILGLSIVLYAYCGFLPRVRFGLLLCGMMLAVLIGDLILLPPVGHARETPGKYLSYLV